MINELNTDINIEERFNKLENLVRESIFYSNMSKNSIAVPVGKNEILTRIFTGQLMYVDERDLSVTPHLIMNGEWEMEITKVFREFIKEDSIVFDVGANSGYFGIVAGSKIKNGSIHFFEANPNLSPLIKKCLWVNGLMNCSKVNQKAVSDVSGKTVKLKIVKNLWGSSTLHEIASSLNVEIENEIDVETISLDDYIDKNKIEKVDVIKIDVEGHEEHVFKGMTKLIHRNPNLVILMEYTFGKYSYEFFTKLHENFKKIYAIVDDKAYLANSEAEMQKYANEWTMLLLTN